MVFRLLLRQTHCPLAVSGRRSARFSTAYSPASSNALRCRRHFAFGATCLSLVGFTHHAVSFSRITVLVVSPILLPGPHDLFLSIFNDNWDIFCRDCTKHATTAVFRMPIVLWQGGEVLIRSGIPKCAGTEILRLVHMCFRVNDILRKSSPNSCRLHWVANGLYMLCLGYRCHARCAKWCVICARWGLFIQ